MDSLVNNYKSIPDYQFINSELFINNGEYMINFLIVVGTVKGHALLAAEGAAAILKKLGHNAEITSQTTPEDLTRDKREVILVCCSTTGNGQIPENIYSLFLALDNRQVDLRDRIYGFIALGDSYFPPKQYALGGITLENAFYSAGAKRIGSIGLLDAQTVNNYALASALWVKDWVAILPQKHLG